ncbi:polyprenyl synthetase family protein [Halocatena halophila]|uniref:polyprenyl synthetase family protein n=1 Tax=Halocatena halophila TaxID=2814576 RepID=UPI002ED2EBDC
MSVSGVCGHPPRPQHQQTGNLDIAGYSALWSAFQIRDDLLDFEREKGRKITGGDVRSGKRTLMAIHADNETIYQILDAPASETTAEDVATVRNIYREEKHCARPPTDAFAGRHRTRLDRDAPCVTRTPTTRRSCEPLYRQDTVIHTPRENSKPRWNATRSQTTVTPRVAL